MMGILEAELKVRSQQRMVTSGSIYWQSAEATVCEQ